MAISDGKDARRVQPVLRYPGGKRRMLRFLSRFLPHRDEIRGRYVEPFVGGGAVFFHVQPTRAILSDSNPELIDVYQGIRDDPSGVWEKYRSYGSTKKDYDRVRRLDPSQLGLSERAARLLYLNRTCFKGNWRHNSKGEFNIGYGGQSRRWVITEDCLLAACRALRCAQILCGDFEIVIDSCSNGDYLFLDPPYQPGKSQLVNDHYGWRQFALADHERLATVLRRCVQRGAAWCMTTSAHPDIVRLFEGFETREIPTRTRVSSSSGEVLILSHGGGG